MAKNKLSYKDAMDSVHAPDSLVKKTIAAMNAVMDEKDSSAKTASRAKKKRAKAKKAGKSSPSFKRLALITVGAVACALLLVGMRARFPQISDIFGRNSGGRVSGAPADGDIGTEIYSGPDGSDSGKDNSMPEHRHVWQAATCTEPQRCSICGITSGAPLGHDWKNASYDKPRTCARCGMTVGSALEQEYKCTVENRTDSPVSQLYIYPDGSAKRGKDRITFALGAGESTTIEFTSAEATAGDTYTLEVFWNHSYEHFNGLKIQDLLGKTVTLTPDETNRIKLSIS